MAERLKVAFVCDDANSLEAVLRSKSIPAAVHASVIVTDDPSFPMGVRKFAAKFGSELKDMEPGLHLSLFTGKFPDNANNLFGSRGRLLPVLKRIEKLKRRGSRLGWAAALVANSRFEDYSDDIAKEIIRQADIADEIFGCVPYMAPHFGLWNWGFLYREYHRTAHALGIPHRGATKYNRLQVHDNQMVFHDSLNHRGVNADEVFGALQNIRKRGIPTEVCWHFGDRKYGQQQTDTFMDPRVQQELGRLRVMMPHDILSADYQEYEIHVYRNK